MLQIWEVIKEVQMQKLYALYSSVEEILEDKFLLGWLLYNYLSYVPA